jgi:xylan 1,4-beta-xylosidase
MSTLSRRQAFKAALAGASAGPLAAASAHGACPASPPSFGRGIEGQRKADLGNGTFRNPIVPGDHADPTILKDGENYYMTFSSFLSNPGAVIWHSRARQLGTDRRRADETDRLGRAMGLIKHQGRYLCIPSLTDTGTIHVITPTTSAAAGASPST